MKILAVVLALVLILVFAASAAAHSDERLVAPPLGETFPVEEITPALFTGSDLVPVYKVGGKEKTLPKSCPAPLDWPTFDCPLEQVTGLY